MRSLQLLHKPLKCVAQLSGAVCVVPTAVREDDARAPITASSGQPTPIRACAVT
jgi:hypothetical protein